VAQIWSCTRHEILQRGFLKRYWILAFMMPSIFFVLDCSSFFHLEVRIQDGNSMVVRENYFEISIAKRLFLRRTVLYVLYICRSADSPYYTLDFWAWQRGTHIATKYTNHFAFCWRNRESAYGSWNSLHVKRYMPEYNRQINKIFNRFCLQGPVSSLLNNIFPLTLLLPVD